MLTVKIAENITCTFASKKSKRAFLNAKKPVKPGRSATELETLAYEIEMLAYKINGKCSNQLFKQLRESLYIYYDKHKDEEGYGSSPNYERYMSKEALEAFQKWCEETSFFEED